MSEIKNAG